MVIDAAENGQGVGLARTSLAAWTLINGRLVAPFSVILPLVQGLLDRLPAGHSRLPKITTFREWLLSEIADDAHRLGALVP